LPASGLLVTMRAARSIRVVRLGPFARIVVGYVPTAQGVDARTLGVDLAAVCGAELLLVSVVGAVWLEHVGEQRGSVVVDGSERERAASALEQAAAELEGVSGVGAVKRRLQPSGSPARGRTTSPSPSMQI
jgi:hypothetical protein